MTTRHTRLAATVLVAALVTAACSSDDPEADATPSETMSEEMTDEPTPDATDPMTSEMAAAATVEGGADAETWCADSGQAIADAYAEFAVAGAALDTTTLGANVTMWVATIADSSPVPDDLVAPFNGLLGDLHLVEQALVGGDAAAIGTITSAEYQAEAEVRAEAVATGLATTCGIDPTPEAS